MLTKQFKARLLNLLPTLGCILIILLNNNQAHAQHWAVPAKTGELMFNATVYIESIHARPGSKVMDTLAGTGTLITDKGKVYLITTKHIIQRDLLGKDQQLANDSIYVNPSWRTEIKGSQIKDISGRAGVKTAVVFSSDPEDLAIISFQRKDYQPILANLFKNGKKPVPISCINISNHYKTGQDFYHVRFISMRDKQGKPERSQGLAPGKINRYEYKLPFFSFKEYYYRGTEGSPLFESNKLIGIITGFEGIMPSTSLVYVANPTEEIAHVLKASYILPLLKKLQQAEDTPNVIKSGKDAKTKINAVHTISH